MVDSMLCCPQAHFSIKFACRLLQPQLSHGCHESVANHLSRSGSSSGQAKGWTCGFLHMRPENFESSDGDPFCCKLVNRHTHTRTHAHTGMLARTHAETTRYLSIFTYELKIQTFSPKEILLMWCSHTTQHLIST